MNLLIEAKYRQPGTKWLFVPEINNDDNYKVDSQESKLFNLVDEFSTQYFDADNSLKIFEGTIPVCLKGTEIKSDGTVVDSEIKHGIYQLRYGLPYFYMDKIDFNLIKNEYNIPFLVTPILITTAPLFILNKECNIETVKNCEQVEEIAHQVPYLTSYYPIGGDFTKHSEKVFSDYNKYLIEHKNLFDYNSLRTFDKLYSPYEIVRGFHYGMDHTLNRYFGKVIVCSFEYFETFLADFHKGVEKLTTHLRSFKNHDPA